MDKDTQVQVRLQSIIEKLTEEEMERLFIWFYEQLPEDMQIAFLAEHEE